MLKTTEFIGKNFLSLTSCLSTNSYTQQLCQSGLAMHGLVVSTYHQSGGRGQRGNKWLTEPGKNLTFSVALHGLAPELISLRAAVAIHKAMTSLELDPTRMFVKWPNDVWHATGKVSGVLVDQFGTKSGDRWHVVGMGINVNQSDFKRLSATSMCNIAQKNFSLHEVMEWVCGSLEQTYLWSVNQLIEYTNQYLFKKGEVVTLRGSMGISWMGVLKGINYQGMLMLETGHALLEIGEEEGRFVF